MDVNGNLRVTHKRKKPPSQATVIICKSGKKTEEFENEDGGEEEEKKWTHVSHSNALREKTSPEVKRKKRKCPPLLPETAMSNILPTVDQTLVRIEEIIAHEQYSKSLRLYHSVPMDSTSHTTKEEEEEAEKEDETSTAKDRRRVSDGTIQTTTTTNTSLRAPAINESGVETPSNLAVLPLQPEYQVIHVRALHNVINALSSGEDSLCQVSLDHRGISIHFISHRGETGVDVILRQDIFSVMVPPPSPMVYTFWLGTFVQNITKLTKSRSAYSVVFTPLDMGLKIEILQVDRTSIGHVTLKHVSKTMTLAALDKFSYPVYIHIPAGRLSAIIGTMNEQISITYDQDQNGSVQRLVFGGEDEDVSTSLSMPIQDQCLHILPEHMPGPQQVYHKSVMGVLAKLCGKVTHIDMAIARDLPLMCSAQLFANISNERVGQTKSQIHMFFSPQYTTNNNTTSRTRDRTID